MCAVPIEKIETYNEIIIKNYSGDLSLFHWLESLSF